MPKVIYSREYLRYSFGENHSFSPLRVEILLDLLAALGHGVVTVAPRAATRDEILGVHEERYVRAVEAMSAGELVAGHEEFGLGTPDNPAFPGMDEAARWQVGGTLLGARLVGEEGEKRVLQLGGGLHHARPGAASGFCVYNDLAIAARYLRSNGLRVAYLDIDVHHGDGVQEILYSDRRVMTISLHESGAYLFPGTGEIFEIGEGAARGLKLNVPLEPFTEGDSYLEVLEAVVPVALSRYCPDVLLVQAGADAHFDDPLADLMLTTRDYERIFRDILAWADEHASGRVLFTLGGGYSLKATPRVWAILYCVIHDLPLPGELPEAWRKKWSSVLGNDPPAHLHDSDPAYPPLPNREEIAHRNLHQARRLMEAVGHYWL